MVRVLVVDDDEPIRELLSMYFKQIGWEVLTASNGVEAVQVFQSCPDLIDVVLTDLAMPVMSGYEAARLIWEAKPDAKVMCMSSYPDNLPPNGATLFPKPFKLDALREAICEAVGPIFRCAGDPSGEASKDRLQPRNPSCRDEHRFNGGSPDAKNPS